MVEKTKIIKRLSHKHDFTDSCLLTEYQLVVKIMVNIHFSLGHDYNNFESLDNTERFDKSQQDISYTLPASVYCNLIKTLKTKCFETSILEIWKYHEKTIEKLTDNDVINAVHVLKRRSAQTC